MKTAPSPSSDTGKPVRKARLLSAAALGGTTLISTLLGGASPANSANLFEALFGTKDKAVTDTRTPTVTGKKIKGKTKEQAERPPTRRVADLPSVRAKIAKAVARSGFELGSPIYVRVFKEFPNHSRGALELWMKKDGRFQVFKRFPLLKYSGGLGGKVREGDYQAPEGFYSIGNDGQFNPFSREYLSINTGFPNALDRANKFYGTDLMIHGGNLSIGCYAIGDDPMEFLYVTAEAAWNKGQRNIPMHLMPMPMTAANMATLAKQPNAKQWMPLWRSLKQGYDLFEATGVPPVADVAGTRYAVRGAKDIPATLPEPNEGANDVVVTAFAPFKKVPLPVPRPVELRESKPTFAGTLDAALAPPKTGMRPEDEKAMKLALQSFAIAAERCVRAKVADTAVSYCMGQMRAIFNANKALDESDVFVRPSDGEVRLFTAGKGDSLRGFRRLPYNFIPVQIVN